MSNAHDDLNTFQLLIAAVPAPDPAPYQSWEDVLRRARVEQTHQNGKASITVADLDRNSRKPQQRPMLRRRWLMPALAAALLLVTGAAVAAVTGIPWWQNAAPSVNPAVVDWQLSPPADGNAFPPTANRADARTVAQADGAALVAAPVGESGYCIIPSLPRSPDIGFSCTYQVTDPASGNDDDLRSYARPASAGTPQWIVYGRITDPNAATLDLSQAADVPFEIALQPGGFFIANIPADRWSTLANQAGPGAILNASGTTIRSGCVNWGPSPDSPGAGDTRYPIWSDSSGPCTPRAPIPSLQTVDLANAHQLVSLTLTSDFSIYKSGTVIALWEAPGAGGGTCIFTAKANEAPTPWPGSGDNPVNGGGCSSAGNPQPLIGTQNPIGVSSSGGRVNGTWSGIIEGRVDPASGITKLELQSATSSIPVPLENGWFLAELPPASSPTAVPSGGPYTLIGYDANGNQIATTKP